MSSTDHTCRICRGEATSSQPLYHPCKCRGSIKYIHQDCLMEWLKHSNKSTEKCDICNSPYKFKIIYDPAMPQYIPLDLIWKNSTNHIFNSIQIDFNITIYTMHCYSSAIILEVLRKSVYMGNRWDITVSEPEVCGCLVVW